MSSALYSACKVALCAAFISASSFFASAVDQTVVAYPSIEDSRQMAEDGDIPQAIEGLRQLLEHEPKNGDARLLLGKLAWASGLDDLALSTVEESRRQGNLRATLLLAEWAIDSYDFDRAESLIESMRKVGRGKAGRRATPFDEEVRALQQRMERLRENLERVEIIQVIDSINVDADSFLQAYKLSPESGSLSEVDGSIVFMPQSGRQKVWAEPDTAGIMRLTEAFALYGDKWEEPSPLDIDIPGDAAYPFVMPDGITLYYAAETEDGLGGYDIYMARKGADAYLEPVNVGMPYNSSYNDFMMAVDEVNGVGWFASDRNRIPGQLTVYIFIPSEMRTNADPEDPDLRAKALLSPISATWQDGKDYSEILRRLRSVSSASSSRKQDFRINVPSRGIITRYDQLPAGARAKAKKYVAACKNLEEANKRLAVLRAEYASVNPADSVSSDILSLEAELPSLRQAVSSSLNELIRSL